MIDDILAVKAKHLFMRFMLTLTGRAKSEVLKVECKPDRYIIPSSGMTAFGPLGRERNSDRLWLTVDPAPWELGSISELVEVTREQLMTSPHEGVLRDVIIGKLALPPPRPVPADVWLKLVGTLLGDLDRRERLDDLDERTAAKN